MAIDWHWRRGSKPKPSSTSNMSKTTSVSGCITAVFRLFGPHWPLNYRTRSGSSSCPKPQSCLSPHTTTTTIAQCIAGEEAPRNRSVSLTSTSKDEKNLDIPMGLEIKTSGGDTSSILNDTPRTNTPTLVARLMGLDLLPETDSPSFRTRAKSRSSHQTRDGTRSLPETPRTSSARRSDVDHHRHRHHHRLSLQINIENMSASEKLAMSRLSSLMKRRELEHDEHEMVKKHVTQSVTRKVGMNITNAYSNREEHVGHFKYKRIDDSSSKFLASTNHHEFRRTKPSPRIRHKLQAVEEEQDEQHEPEPRVKSKCKKGSNKKFISRLKKPQQAPEINRNKKEEPFVRPSTANRASFLDKKCRKTPLSNELVQVKKYPSPQTTKIPEKQDLDAQRPKQSSGLEDIDGLIVRDLTDAKLENVMVYEEEGEGIVEEIEKDILESLIHEISEA